MRLVASVVFVASCVHGVDSGPPLLPPPRSPVAAPPLSGVDTSPLGGIGVVLRDHAGALAVTRVLTRTPACHEGVRAGDLLLAVDGVPVAGMAIDDVVAKLRGPQGSLVALAVQREAARIDLAIARDLISLTSLDVDCVHALETKPVIAGLTANLDGGGGDETITLASHDAARHWSPPSSSQHHVAIARAGRAVLAVGSATWSIVLAEGDRVGLEVIDIDASDPRREVLLRHASAGSEDSELHVFVFDGARLAHTRLERGRWVTATETGLLVVEQSPDADNNATTIRYQLPGATLVEVARRTRPYESD